MCGREEESIKSKEKAKNTIVDYLPYLREGREGKVSNNPCVGAYKRS